MGKIGIIKKRGIEEIVFKENKPELIFGLSNAPAQKKERKSIGNALMKIGLLVYASTNTLWPKDAYSSNNGLVLPQKYFGNLATEGNYFFGEGFILVSSAIKEDLEKKLKESKHLERFFSGSEIIFIPPYSKKIVGIENFALKPWHIDLTIGYVPNIKLLLVDERHYHQEEKLFEELRKKFNINIEVTKADNFFRNNFFAIDYNGTTNVVVNCYNNPFKKKNSGLKVIKTDKDIINLPGKFGGSVNCAANISPTTKLWDALGIEYRRWGVNPKQANYAMR